MIICKVAMDIANNNSAIASVLYEVLEDGTRRKIPNTARLWRDREAIGRNSALIPSVILYEDKNKKQISKDFYGIGALEIIEKNDELKVTKNIKHRLFVEDNSYGKAAEDFTNLAKYLLNCIRMDEDVQPDSYEIWISHPVICDEDNLFHLENIINNALDGHPMQYQDVRFINEAECAFRFALSDKKVQTAICNTLTVRNKAIALICDIGGSTMELSLYSFAKDGQKIRYTLESILRADDEAGRDLGCYAMDKVLFQKLSGINNVGILDKNKIGKIDNSLLMLRWITPLKEELNDRLCEGRNGSLNRLHSIAIPEKLMQNNNVDKQQFEQWCSGYTAAICKQIKKLAIQANITPEDIDMAFLTGGGCKLYPIEIAIRELLKPGEGNKACVLRPNDPSSMLDGQIAEVDHPDYFKGLCPKTEIASLACVLGNLGGEVELTMPVSVSVEQSTEREPIVSRDSSRYVSECSSKEDASKSKHPFLKAIWDFLGSLPYVECEYEHD